MSAEIEQRAHEIIEELRADIDFELDDVIARIVRGLPEDYFKMLSRDDQLRQLKALLAMGVCNLSEEIMLRSDDGQQVAVVARKNHPGLLANLLRRIPAESELIGAKIFTSTDHDFIIDLFEFKPVGKSESIAPVDRVELESTIESVVAKVGLPIDQVRKFVSQYHPGNRILSSPSDVADQFLVCLDSQRTNKTAIRWVAVNESESSRVTVASSSRSAREVFRKTAEFLAMRAWDIDRAFLHDLPLQEDAHMAIASFLVTGPKMELKTTESKISTDVEQTHRGEELLNPIATELANFL
ncbi:MAG: hypothetical protein OSA89_06330 [Mariniblastus sp.]|nr:hypothetical protein [Mariniblastus sp.]